MRTTLLCAAAVALATGSAAAAVPTPCAPRGAIAKTLAEKYSEAHVASGLQLNGMVLEVYASPDGKTWTVLLTSPDRTSCIVGAGKSWTPVDLLGEPS